MCQLKKKDNGQSKGFAFIHYDTEEAQKRAIQQRHWLGDRWCDVKVPNSQDKTGFKETDSAREFKICVRRLDDSISKEELSEHFEKFGRITDIFYPKPSRGFAFVTFMEKNVAKSLIGLEHNLKNVTVSIQEPTSKPKFEPCPNLASNTALPERSVAQYFWDSGDGIAYSQPYPSNRAPWTNEPAWN